ncbi:MAG: PBP1A family penicillin-binding protein, partial [Candidatus Zixiibacteriota bacterium]
MKTTDRNIFRNKQKSAKKPVLIAAGLAVALVLIASVRTLRIYQSELPSFEQLHNIEQNLSTRVYDRNGKLLKEFYTENRALTPFKEFPPHLVDMVLASEDQEFYDHWGISLRRIAIVAVNNVLHGRITAGASTISQQVARMLFLDRSVTYERKIKEALTAIKLERTYAKDEILEMYLNQHYFGRGAYGVMAAARLYFDKRVSELSVNDCAILIGMLKGPNINSPLNNPDKALQARNRVLGSFLSVGAISRTEFDSLRAAPLEISPPEEEIGLAPYFTETVRQHIYNTYGEDVLYSGGLKVFTTLDAGLQEIAEKALAKKVDSIRARIERTYSLSNPSYTTFLPDTVNEYGDSIRVFKKVQGAFVALDNSNGDVLAMIGGRSFEETELNRSWQSPRQAGSVFKPFVYSACIDNGFRTTDIVDDNPLVLDIPGAPQWRPHNFDSKFMGPIPLRTALMKSRNLAAIKLLLKISPQEAIFYARRMGLTTPLPEVASLAIGTADVRLIEMVSAFSVFPNRGLHIPYRYIHSIVDRDGKVLEDNTSVHKEEVLSAQTAYIMVDLMQSVVSSEGTARRARWMGFSRPAGGKTGTSNRFCDAWFIGYTPQISAGVWVGFDDRTSLGLNQDGAKNGVPIWTEFMIAAHDTLPIMGFEEPEGIVHEDVCLESGEIATDRCLDVRNEVFIEGNHPTTTCSIHPSSGLFDPLKHRRIELPEDTASDRTHF